MRRPRHRRADDRGSLAAVELPFATLWIAAVALVVLTFPTWNERADAARAAADGAARAVATADTWEGGVAKANSAVDETVANYDLAPGDLTLELDGALERGAEVTARVTFVVPGADLPLVGEIGSFRRSVSHTERVDEYRAIS
jgi:hypothetical protein